MNVLLISMPFASVQFASMGLSCLRPALEREGIKCDIQYQNLSFRNFVKDTKDYDDLTERCLLGEWVFGCELFGRAWAECRQGSIEALSDVIKSRSGLINPERITDTVLKYRRAAGAFLEQCVAGTDWQKYEVIGFTSVFDQQIASLALAQRIKERYPEKVIVFGGANCQDEMGLAVLDLFPFVDWVISGDGEYSLPQAVKRWFAGDSLEGIEGLAYRKDGKAAGQGTARIMELDELPYPDFTDYFQAVEKWAPDLKGKVPLSIELSRGCWWSSKSQCIFCGIHSELNEYRQKSPNRALDEIEELVSRYGVDHVWVIDSNLPPGYFHSVLPMLGKREKKLSSFFVETKATLIRDQLQALKQAGATAFQPGIESLDTEILRYMSKGTTKLQNVRILKWAREYGLLPVWNFLHSFPGENEEAYRRMASAVPWLVHLQPPLNVGPVALQRFSPMYRNPEQWKITNARASKSYEFIYPFSIKEQNRLAYTFEYDVAEEGLREKNSAEKDGMLWDALNASVNEIVLWKDLWGEKEPPLLAYQWTSEGGMTVYDTRPARKSSCTDLDRPLALALYGCDSERNFHEICEYVKDKMGETDYPGDEYLQAGVNVLEEKGFLLREEDNCLSLVLPMEAHRKNNDSFLAYLLGN